MVWKTCDHPMNQMATTKKKIDSNKLKSGSRFAAFSLPSSPNIHLSFVFGEQREQIQETTNVIQDIRPKLVSTWENVDGLMSQLKDAVPAMDEANQKLMEDTKQYLVESESLVND